MKTIICPHCELSIRDGDTHPERQDHHHFCYEIIKGQFLEDLEEILRESGDYVEVSPGKYMAKNPTAPGKT